MALCRLSPCEVLRQSHKFFLFLSVLWVVLFAQKTSKPLEWMNRSTCFSNQQKGRAIGFKKHQEARAVVMDPATPFFGLRLAGVALRLTYREKSAAPYRHVTTFCGMHTADGYEIRWLLPYDQKARNKFAPVGWQQ